MKLDLRTSAFSALACLHENISILPSNCTQDFASLDAVYATCIGQASQKTIKQKINHLRSDMFVLESPSHVSVLVHENTPISLKKNLLFPQGITYATSQFSLNSVYEDAMSLNTLNNSIPHATFSKPICCVGGSNVFGHFLLQCIPKLINAKKNGLFESHTFVLSGVIPSIFLQFADYLGLLPHDFVLLPPLTSVTSRQAIAFSITPIMSTISLKSHLLNVPIDLKPDKFIEGYGLAIDLYHELHHLVLSCGYTPRESYGFQKVYLTRRSGTHRDLQNRSEILEVAIAAGFKAICIEELSLSEQFCLFAECQYLVTEVGSTACNAWMMPNLIAGLELCIDTVYGAWGLLLASGISGFKFFRVNGVKIPGTLKRFDSDPSKKALETDYDFRIQVNDFSVALGEMMKVEP